MTNWVPPFLLSFFHSFSSSCFRFLCPPSCLHPSLSLFSLYFLSSLPTSFLPPSLLPSSSFFFLSLLPPDCLLFFFPFFSLFLLSNPASHPPFLLSVPLFCTLSSVFQLPTDLRSSVASGWESPLLCPSAASWPLSSESADSVSDCMLRRRAAQCLLLLGPMCLIRRQHVLLLGAPQGDDVSSQMAPDASLPLGHVGARAREVDLWLKCCLYMDVQIPASTFKSWARWHIPVTTGLVVGDRRNLGVHWTGSLTKISKL